MNSTSLYQCPKFQKCNAPICSLEPNWKKRKHISGDRVCFYLIEAQKHGANAVFEVRSLTHLYEAMVMHTSEIAGTYSIINTAINKAKITTSRMSRKVGVK